MVATPATKAAIRMITWKSMRLPFKLTYKPRQNRIKNDNNPFLDPMSMMVEPVHPTVAARIRGLDLTRPLTDLQVQEVEQASGMYPVLIFPELSTFRTRRLSGSVM